MATKNNPGAWDCYANADPDEPMFVLLARDELAPDLVALWACVRSHCYGAAHEALARLVTTAAAKDTPNSAKVTEAFDCADAMRQYNSGLSWAAELDAARTYKVIDVDNLGRDYQTEYLIEGSEGLTKEAAQQVADWVNSQRPHGGEFSDRYCTVVNNERKLYVFDGY